MQADFQRLKRRPFLVPLLMPLALFALVVAAALWLLDARTATVMVVVRHAETEQRASTNPQLSSVGQSRAVTLQQWLAQAKPHRGIDAVYVSEDSPSQQTAAPLAQSMGLAVNVVPTSDWNSLPRFIDRNHAGEVTLVVANRSALLAILKNMTKSEPALAEDDFGAAFVIFRSRLSKTSVIRLRY